MDETGTDLGSSTIYPNGPVPAGSKSRWKISYTAGETKITQGDAVRFEIPFGFSHLQNMCVSEAGYTYAECSDPEVKISTTIAPSDNENLEQWKRTDAKFYYVTRTGHHVFVQIEEGTLQKGHSITLFYGHAPFINTDAKAPKYVRSSEFLVAVDPDGKRSGAGSGYYLLAEQPSVDVIPAKPDGFEVFSRSTSQQPGSEWYSVPLDKYENCADHNAYIPGQILKSPDSGQLTVQYKNGMEQVSLKLSRSFGITLASRHSTATHWTRIFRLLIPICSKIRLSIISE